MKNVLSWIRWKFVIPVGIFIGLLMVFFMIFFDPLLERGLEKVGSRINGAKVEIDNLKTKFLRGRLTVGRVQIANRKQPMINRMEAGPLAFQLDLGNLFTKRVIIPESRMDGIQFGTERKTSGVLPKRIRKKIEKKEEDSAAVKLVNKYKNRFKLNLDGLKGQVKEKIEFNEDDLEIKRQADALKEKANVLPVQWKNKINNLDFDGRIKKVEGDIKSIKETPTKGIEALTAIPRSLEKLKQAKNELGQIKKDVKDVKSNLKSEISTLKSEVKDLKKAKNKDLDYLTSKLNLEFANPDRLVEGLIGGAVLERVQTALRYVELARRHLPSKKEKESLPQKTRAGGMDIEFPKPASPPRLWLKEGALSGQVKDLSVAGFVRHLTSDPPRVGEPLVIQLSGTRGREKFKAEVTADHTGDVKKDSFVLEAKGLRLKKLVSGGVLGEALNDGAGEAEFVFYAKGEEQIGGNLTLALSQLKFDDATLLKEAGIEEGSDSSFKKSIQAKFITNIARAIEKMKKVGITATLFGTWGDPDIKISSNLGPELSKVLKSTIGNVAKDQRKELEAKLNAIYKKELNQVQAKLKELQGGLDKELGGFESKIQSEIEKATKINLTPSSDGSSGIKIPALDNIFK